MSGIYDTSSLGHRHTQPTCQTIPRISTDADVIYAMLLSTPLRLPPRDAYFILIAATRSYDILPDAFIAGQTTVRNEPYTREQHIWMMLIFMCQFTPPSIFVRDKS